MTKGPASSLISSINPTNLPNLIREYIRYYQRRTPTSLHSLLWILIASLPVAVWYRFWRQTSSDDADTTRNDAASTDPGLLKKWSTFSSYHVPSTGFTYSSIRTFYRDHPQASKLPSKPTPLPLLVFVHGLGGSAAQFNPLLTSLVNVGPCLVVDLPGCGLSKFDPQDWEAYTFNALTQLLTVIIEAHRDAQNDQRVIFIGHSMGCSLAAKLASRNSNDVGKLPQRTAGLIAICPRISQISGRHESAARRLLNVPTFLFNLFRKWDQRGGQESNSVQRFVGTNAEPEAKRLQLRYNEQSKTAVWRRMAYGLLPTYSNGTMKQSFPSENIWAGLDVPVFLIGGEGDTVTPPEEVGTLASTIQSSWKIRPGGGMTERKLSDPNSTLHHDAAADLDEPMEIPSGAENDSIDFKSHKALKTTILPKPASHALIFAPNTVRVISGLIQSFLGTHIDPRLSLGWQLQYLSTGGKWDVKNLRKWQAIDPISEPIGTIFRAMKTMREVDDSHCPKEFAKEWHTRVGDVVDISHENPVYDPAGLEQGGIHYHKFPTVSKHPPQPDEITAFIDLIDRIVNDRSSSPAQNENVRPRSRTKTTSSNLPDGKTIAVHCHYGFNRTGFLIVCYLIERRGWRLQDAVEEFQRQRPPGIKHDYFVDSLAVRYAKGLGRAPTL